MSQHVTSPKDGCRRHRVLVAALITLPLVTAQATPVKAELAFHRDLNGPDPIWRLVETSVPTRIVAQECVSGGARDDGGVERIVAAAPAGQSLLLSCPTPRVAVLPELQARLWMKSDSPAVQAALRIVLPRSPDPQTGKATTVIVRGTQCGRPGHWQQLIVADVPKRLAAKIRVLRSAPGASIDSKEAFVDAVMLIVPGEPQGFEVLVDELEVDGVLMATLDDIELTGHSASEPISTASVPTSDGSVRLQGGILLVDDKPFVPRAIEWRGESLEFLAERGFNTVQLPDMPTQEQITEAEKQGLWFVATVPGPVSLASQQIGQSGDRILAWLLEDEAIEVDPNYGYRWANLIRERDTVAGRPVIFAPHSNWGMGSKAVDIVVARHLMASRLSAEEFGAWMDERPHFARPGTPLWAGFATQLGEAAHQQAMAISTTRRPPATLDVRQIERQAHMAATRGVRGFVFHSRSPLTEPDAATRRRAGELELINRRLQLLEPWLAGGNTTGRVASTDGAWTGVVMQVDRARLVIPVSVDLNTKANGTAIGADSTTAGVSFVVPGVPESSRAYLLSPVALRNLPTQRVAGGTRFTLPSVKGTFALITEDPQVVRFFRDRVAREGASFVRLQRELLVQRSAFVAYAGQQHAALPDQSEMASQTVAAVNTLLPQIDAHLSAGRPEKAYEVAQSAQETLAGATATQPATAPAMEFDSNPLAISDEYAAEYATFQRSYDTFRGGENLLYVGDFEDLGQMTHFGWRHYQNPQPGIETHVELSVVEPKQGRYCLALKSSGITLEEPSATDGDVGIWVVSPAIAVQQGQLIEITGWVRVDSRAAETTGDGLRITDSLGGPELSLAVRETSGWQPFRMLRIAPQSTELRLTFALAGTCSARIDSVMVRPLTRPIARRLPPAAASLSR